MAPLAQAFAVLCALFLVSTPAEATSRVRVCGVETLAPELVDKKKVELVWGIQAAIGTHRPIRQVGETRPDGVPDFESIFQLMLRRISAVSVVSTSEKGETGLRIFEANEQNCNARQLVSGTKNAQTLRRLTRPPIRSRRQIEEDNAFDAKELAEVQAAFNETSLILSALRVRYGELQGVLASGLPKDGDLKEPQDMRLILRPR